MIATVEKIISREELTRKGVTIPYFYVTAISEVAYGAHPTSCYPFYAYDREHTSLYYEAARESREAFAELYLQPYVFDLASNKDYIAAIGGEERLKQLREWNSGAQQWMALYA